MRLLKVVKKVKGMLTVPILRKLGVALGVIVAGIWLILPLWMDMDFAQTESQKFIENAKESGAEAKIVSAVHYPENFFTWLTPMPRLAVARKSIDSSFLMVYQKITDDGIITDKALINASCAEKTFRLVDYYTYNKLLDEQVYDALGRKLPTWDEADFNWMQRAMLSIESRREPSHILYRSACEWDNINL